MKARLLGQEQRMVITLGQVQVQVQVQVQLKDDDLRWSGTRSAAGRGS